MSMRRIYLKSYFSRNVGIDKARLTGLDYWTTVAKIKMSNILNEGQFGPLHILF